MERVPALLNHERRIVWSPRQLLRHAEAETLIVASLEPALGERRAKLGAIVDRLVVL